MLVILVWGFSWSFLARTFALAFALTFAWLFLAAAGFLDPPPPRLRSEEDFMGRPTLPVLCDPAGVHIIAVILHCNINIAMHKKAARMPRIGHWATRPAN